MDYAFDDYNICIVDSNNYPGKFVAYIEELHNVAAIVDNKEEAASKLKSLFDKEIKRLKDEGQIIPNPGSGKAKITFAANNEIEKLRPFIDDFWKNIFNTFYTISFVSNESLFNAWEHYLQGGKEELIEKVKRKYNYDITEIYEKPIHQILTKIKNHKSFSNN